MSSENPSSSFSGLSQEVTDNLKQLGLAVPVWDREITHAEIQYFIDRWPYLQILSTNKLEPLDEVQYVTAKSNWTIINYGDALTSSPGKFLFGGGDFRIMLNRDDDDGGGGDIVNPGKGTIWRQAFDTVGDMIQLAKQLGWEGVHIIDGHPLMKWAAWMKAVEDGMSLSGFSPTERDIARRERVRRSEVEDAKRFSMRPRV